MKKLLAMLTLVGALGLAAYGQVNATATNTSHDAAETNAHELALGDPIHLTRDANGKRDVTLTINDIKVSKSCFAGEKDSIDQVKDPGYYVTLLGEIDAKTAEDGYSLSVDSLSGKDKAGQSVKFAPASSCNNPVDAMDGYQSFEKLVKTGEKARGILEFYSSANPETITYEDSYENDSWQWSLAKPKKPATSGATITTSVAVATTAQSHEPENNCESLLPGPPTTDAVNNDSSTTPTECAPQTVAKPTETASSTLETLTSELALTVAPTPEATPTEQELELTTASEPIPAVVPAPKDDNAIPIEASIEQSPSPTPQPVFYANCSEARAAGAAPIYEGSPGYRSKLDRDGDGVACE